MISPFIGPELVGILTSFLVNTDCKDGGQTFLLTVPRQLTPVSAKETSANLNPSK